jgi:spore germination protein KA
MSVLFRELDTTISHVSDLLGASSDLIVRSLCIKHVTPLKVAVLFLDGMVDTRVIHETIVNPLQTREIAPDTPLIPFIQDFVLSSGEVRNIDTFEKLLEALVSGDTVLLLDGEERCLVIGTKGFEERSVQEPTSQSVLRGPREGFTENIRTNSALIRRKIKNPRLWMESMKIGEVTQTDVAIMYVDGIVDNAVLERVRQRLAAICIDSVLESNYIEEIIADENLTPFPTVYNTERPDVVASALMEGRVAILVDGTPFVLIVPVIFTQFFQSPEDYYQRFDAASFIRLLRFFSFFIALLAPSFYVAVTTFHQELIPTDLLINLASQREGIPLPAFVEAMMMELTFEILREAGIRMPRQVGQAVSIVGALVIGQAAVEAGFISAAMVIVVSITAITNCVFPAYNLAFALRLLRFLFICLAASFGLFGVFLGLIGLLIHLNHLRSFGVPYMSQLGTFRPQLHQDTFFRFPRWMMKLRSALFARKNRVRMR